MVVVAAAPRSSSTHRILDVLQLCSLTPTTNDHYGCDGNCRPANWTLICGVFQRCSRLAAVHRVDAGGEMRLSPVSSPSSTTLPRPSPSPTPKPLIEMYTRRAVNCIFSLRNHRVAVNEYPPLCRTLLALWFSYLVPWSADVC